ncbi:acetyl-CoA C-acyltransferase [Asaia prunellae]
MREAYICDFTRSPIGRYAGALSHVRADDLAAHPIRALRERHPNIDWAALDDCFMGCANQAGEDNRNVARMAVLLAGLPVSAPGTTINRLCGSGLDAVGQAARAIKAGEADLVLAGGVESMSRAPFVMPKATNAFSRDNTVYDTTIGWRFVNPALKELWGCASMPETGENVAAQFGISRADQDAFALRSQQNAEKARLAGYFAREITPIKVTVGRIESLVETDEHPRPETTSESLARLKAPFRKEGGTVTAGNASGVNDGAACLILASEEGIRRFDLTPRARVVAMATAGLEPISWGMALLPPRSVFSPEQVGLCPMSILWS